MEPNATQTAQGSPRATKRERTRARLLANAIALFRKQGVRETRLAEVAEASEVAPATLFNHFPSRAALASAWVRGEIEQQAGVVARAVREEARGLRPSVRALCRELAERNASEPVARWAAWQEAGRARGHGVLGFQEAFAVEQQREHVRADRSPEMLAEMLMDAIEGGLIAGLTVAVESRTSDERARARDLAGRIQTRVDLVLDGARKRNERVRPPAPGRRG
ncbi:MAG: TetR/AcrR family transcriptional regulator [Myxococcota bacterium]